MTGAAVTETLCPARPSTPVIPSSLHCHLGQHNRGDFWGSPLSRDVGCQLHSNSGVGTARPGKAWSRGRWIAGFLEEGRLEVPWKEEEDLQEEGEGHF